MTALTFRQRQVLTLAAFGNTNVMIARILDVHPTTVQTHLTAIYQQLGARDRANAVAIAIHRGDISLAELARIAAASSPRGAETQRAGTGRPQGAPEASGGARDVRGAPGAAGRRTAPQGEAAA
ncbi:MULTISPECIES: helix-turn-helix domain-containing protein [Streptomyces]|uniref:LuxR family transcriptional regulator n=1 Tax=Streptomyces dengpaensis TaxID=2049881 RepID=A0ABN5IAF9_9ACTN|nr:MULTISPECIES: helix-turn-helix transcriptional regulator [Streptomyces]AVH59961.1 LuxR family transcriptional regulator [Streptomyces dengpaensis]PIB09596.1 hypothetical protein B1C81_10645 [Streptomyces sp. HG99]